ncbi:MAG TPA: hypothetical protein VMT93_06770 [Gemmatimonadaceae bacterium]|nr:hypothetical protein [Gemmatimonadaceae bacterium]
MRIRSFVRGTALLASLAAAPAFAQGGAVNPACTDTAFVGPAHDGGNACQIAFDAFAYATQQYAILLSAGNLQPGYGDATGGLGHFRIAFNVTGMNLAAPALNTTTINPGPPAAGTVNTQPTDFAIFALNASVGLFGGFDAGIGKMGAIDGWVSLNGVPGASASGYSVSPSKKFYFGWGARIGILQEGKVAPGIGVSYLQRNLPSSTVYATDVLENGFTVVGMKIDTHAWAATVGKHLGAVSLLVGAGQTNFSSSANVSWYLNGQHPTVQPQVTASSMQTQFFGDFGILLGGFGITLEVGQVEGSTLKTYNTFDPTAGSARSFASLTVSFGE